MASIKFTETIKLAPFDHNDQQQRQFEVNERRKRQNRIAQRNFRGSIHIIVIQCLCILTISREKKYKELGQQATSASSRVPQSKFERLDMANNLTSSPGSLSLTDPESLAYNDQFITPLNAYSTPYSTYQPFADVPFLSAQGEETHLSSSSYRDQPHQAMPSQLRACKNDTLALFPKFRCSYLMVTQYCQNIFSRVLSYKKYRQYI